MELTIEQALQQGVAAQKEGKLEEAERVYRAILQSQPLHPDANHNLGVLAVSVSKVKLALPLFKIALEANPKIEQFWLSYIDALIKEKRFDNAKEVLSDAKKAEVSETKLNTLNQTLMLATNDTSRSKFNSLLEHYQNGRYDDAEKLGISLTQELPNHPLAWKVLGAIFDEIGKLTEALDAKKRVIQLVPLDAGAHSNLANLLQKLGRLGEAEASYRHSIALDFDFAEAHFNLGIILKKLDRLEEAEACYRQTILLKSDFAEPHCKLGNTLQELGRLDEAEESYVQAIVLKPDYPEAHYNLGKTLQELDRLEEAEASYRQTILLKPDSAQGHYNLGLSLQQLGKLKEAEASYRQTILLKPDFASAHCNLGFMFKNQGRLVEAEVSYKKALEINPDYPQAIHLLASLTGETSNFAPLTYVENLFDGYASTFDNSLVHKLQYKMPKMIVEMICKIHCGEILGSVLDLGCGTGLTGLEIKKYCTNLEGIDISNRMLDKARKKNVYDRLTCRDIVDYLSTENLNFDYFILTDVFIYLGDLSDVFKLIKSRNSSCGKLVFSTEHSNKNGFFLENSGRYSHSKTYIESLCKKYNYTLSHFDIGHLRKEKGVYITGGLYLLDF